MTISRDRASIALGAALYLPAFFLNAVHDGPNSIKGWVCAWMSLTAPFRGAPNILALLLFAAGLINPLVVFHFAAPRFRHITAKLALVLLAVAWLVIWMLHMSPAIGHVLWVAGLALMLMPELLNTRH